ncbi:NfeD family protein [Falsiroseomonas sp.]|jgi:membrane protein implicated in regulation of membrane protease activity|uniref:NfeD family protein n=1 Tax=Falsiroseomonas sp. TaxID=2870721 RepID=UPI003F6E45F1
MEPGLIWILAGLVGLGAELLLPGVWFLWAGLAAIGTGLVVLLHDPGFGLEVAVFLVLLGAGVLASIRMKKRVEGPAHRVNAPEAGLAGRLATVIQVEAGGLRVRLGDSDWAARLPRDAEAAVGDSVRVEGVDGTVLIVRPAGTPRA